MPAFTQGLRRPEGMYYIKATEGLDSLKTDLLIGAKADIAQNLRFSTEVGAVTKRAAVSYYNLTVESKHPESIYRYFRESNNTAYIIGLFDTVLKVATTADFSTLSSTLLANSGGRKFTAVTYKDLCIISTGYDDIVQTDGDVAWQLGSCKAKLVLDSTGAQVPAGAHTYQITIVTGAGEMVNGAISNSVTNNATHTSNTLSNIPLGPDGTTARKIYRKDGSAAYKLVDTISDNATQTYTDIKAGLGADIGTVTSDMPRGRYLYVAQERLFVGCDITAGVGRQSTVYYSDQYIPNYINTETIDMTTTQAANNYEVINPDDNDVITGLINQLGVTYVFKQNSIIPWDVAGTPDVWSVGQAVSMIGSPAPYTIQACPQGIIYQGWDRMYLFNGQYSINIIDDFLFDENFLDSGRSDNVGYFWNNLYLLAYSDANAGNSYTDRVLVYDIIRKQTSIDKGGPLASGTMNVGCFTSARVSTEWGTLYAGDSQLGWVYQYDRTIASNQINTQSAFNLGTYNGTYAAPPEENTQLGGVVLDNMEAYSTDALAQSAWVTSLTAASIKVPPYLGNGTDGVVVISADTTLTGDGNYLNLTIDAGKTLTATNVNIYCMGTVTVNGTINGALTINGQVVTIAAGGSVTGGTHIRCNTLNNAGTIADILKGSVATDGYSQYSPGGGISNTRTTTVSFASCTINRLVYNLSASAGTDGYSYNAVASASVSISLCVNGTWTVIDSASQSVGPQPHNVSANASASINSSLTTGWLLVTGVKATVSSSGGADHDVVINGTISNGSAYQYSACDYVNSTGTVPASGDITDFVPPLQTYSSTAVVNQGTYSLQIVCCPANTLNERIAKVLPQTFNLTSRNTILIDLWALRSGTNLQFGMDNGSPVTTFKNIVVPTAQTWTTYELDFTGATKNAILYLAVKFTNTDTGNIVYIDNIRPSSYAVTPISYLSSRFTINALSMGNMYWNEVLTSAGDVNFYTRTSDSATDFTNWTDDTGWSAALTNPAGSLILSNPKVYFQFKVTFESTDTTGALFPYIYKANGYDIKFTYWKVSATAETAVEFVYRTGWRNFDQPFDDKIYRKFITLHEGTEGYFTATIECGEQDTQTTFNNNQPYPAVLSPSPFQSISLATYPYRWYTTLPDYTYGKELRATIYKNDDYAFKLRQYGVMLETIPLI